MSGLVTGSCVQRETEPRPRQAELPRSETDRETELRQVVQQVLQRVQSSEAATRYLGTPVALNGDVDGQLLVDETGWREARLSIPVRGPKAEGVVKVIGDQHTGAWTFTTLDVVIASQRKRVEVLEGRVVKHNPKDYVVAHRKPAAAPEYEQTSVPPARWDGTFPCIAMPAAPGSTPEIGTCAPAIPIAALSRGPVDRFEVDLRSGRFVLRQTDLMLRDEDMQVPLTRTYTSQFWHHQSKVNAFGRNSMHDFDVAPVGSRNPYLDLRILLPDGDLLHLPRISKGRGYADAVYQHSETSSNFYKTIIRWDGKGWEVKLDDGAMIHFPESYYAKNMAQGAATVMMDAKGRRLRLVRDAQRNLREVHTPHGRWIKFALDERGCVVRAEDDERQWVDYRYGADQMLTEVIFSDGRARRYSYEGDLMTSVRDETGRVLIRNWYRGDKLVLQEYTSGESYRMHYSVGANRYYAEEATVVLPGGSLRSFPVAESVPKFIKDLK
jgi:hypothetical protein